jgi:hypothetical protein
MSEPPPDGIESPPDPATLAAVEEWGTGDWEAETERPPAPWPPVTLAYVLVLGIGAAGLVLMGAVGLGQASIDLFRVGALLVAGAVGLAALLRALLPDRHAGMLVLRSRRVDVALYGALGTAALVLAVLVPPPTG